MASIKDVAKKAGVSIATVSAVLNGNDCVKPETKNKVLAAIRELDYTPNLSARELVTNKKQNIGFITLRTSSGKEEAETPQQREVFYSDYFQVLAKKYADTNYGLLYENYCFNEAESALPMMIRKNRVDSVFVLGSVGASDFINELKDYVKNIVLLGSVSESVSSVYNDYRASVYDSVNYLLSMGHKKIAIANGTKTAAYDLKLKGYLDALTDAGVEIREDYILSGEFTARSGYEITEKIMALKDRPTACFYAGDIMAAGAYRYLFENGISVPNDFSVMGYENIVFSEFLNPGLTSVDFNKEQMANEAFAIMQKLNRDENNGEILRAAVPCRIVKRGSVKKL